MQWSWWAPRSLRAVPVKVDRVRGAPTGRVAKTAGKRPVGRAPGPHGVGEDREVLTGAARGSAEALDFLPGEGEPGFARL